MALNKRAVFFTFTALIFLSLLIIAGSVSTVYDMRERNFVLESRIYTIDNFFTDVETDLEKAAYIAGYRSFVAISNQVLLTGEYRSDIDSSFEEVFIYGTIDGENSSLMTNNTFSTWVEKIQLEAEKLDLTLNLTINDISIEQDDPWNVRINIDLNIVIVDEQNISRYNSQEVLASYVEIEGFTDPIYLIKTGGLVEREIRRSPWAGNFTNGTNIDNLLNHTYEGYFINDDDAPNYLQRLEGILDVGSQYGIESLVNIDELVAAGVSVKDKTIVDHRYFVGAKPNALHVTGAPSWLKIDVSGNHLELYQVTELT